MLVYGHRGAAGLAPENTIPGFLKAMALGAVGVELDLRLSRDGVPVCVHDDRIDRITAETGPVSGWNADVLALFPVMAGAFEGEYADARIPSLAQVIHGLPRHCRFLIELKEESERSETLVHRALEALAGAGAAPRSRILSFEVGLLRLVRSLQPDAPALGVLGGRREVDSLFASARDVRAEAVHPHHTRVDAEFMRRARDEGFRVNAWTVNSAEEASRLSDLGVDEITTDFPGMRLG